MTGVPVSVIAGAEIRNAGEYPSVTSYRMSRVPGSTDRLGGSYGSAVPTLIGGCCFRLAWYSPIILEIGRITTSA